MPDWWALPQWEREEYLAYQEWRNNALVDAAQALIGYENYTPEAHVLLLLAQLA